MVPNEHLLLKIEVVVYETLLSAVDVTAGLKKEGAIVINSSKSPPSCAPC